MTDKPKIKGLLSKRGMKREEAVRLATVLDCEGYIGIVKARPRPGIKSPAYSVRIGVGMTDLKYPTWFHDVFGGTLRKRQGRGENWKPQYDWTISGKKAIAVLETLSGCIYVKAKQALECRTLDAIRNEFGKGLDRRAGLPENLLNLYEECYRRCKKLNERGKPID